MCTTSSQTTVDDGGAEPRGGEQRPGPPEQLIDCSFAIAEGLHLSDTIMGWIVSFGGTAPRGDTGSVRPTPCM